MSAISCSGSGQSRSFVSVVPVHSFPFSSHPVYGSQAALRNLRIRRYPHWSQDPPSRRCALQGRGIPRRLQRWRVSPSESRRHVQGQPLYCPQETWVRLKRVPRRHLAVAKLTLRSHDQMGTLFNGLAREGHDVSLPLHSDVYSSRPLVAVVTVAHSGVPRFGFATADASCSPPMFTRPAHIRRSPGRTPDGHCMLVLSCRVVAFVSRFWHGRANVIALRGSVLTPDMTKAAWLTQLRVSGLFGSSRPVGVAPLVSAES